MARIETILASAGIAVTDWYGVGVFTDHLSGTAPTDEIDDICELEWLAGSLDPYRRVARSIHVLARRTA